MRFDGQIWFDFSSPAVWTLYRWIRQLAEARVAVDLEWLPLPKGTERAAMATFLAIEDPQDRGLYLHAMFGLVHMNAMPASDVKTVQAALEAAGLDSAVVTDAHPLLEGLRYQETELGVGAVPTLYRHGPVLSIQLNPAVLDGDPRETAKTIDAVITSDGIWELRKP